MPNTITGYFQAAASGISKKAGAILTGINNRPKTVAVLFVIATLYLPVLHFGHTYGSSFKHFFKDALVTQLLIEFYQQTQSEFLTWILFAVITLVFLYVLLKAIKSETNFIAPVISKENSEAKTNRGFIQLGRVILAFLTVMWTLSLLVVFEKVFSNTGYFKEHWMGVLLAIAVVFVPAWGYIRLTKALTPEANSIEPEDN